MPKPIVTNVNPGNGPASGGTPVSITGSNFTGATSVAFGGVSASGFYVVNDGQINAMSPQQAAGTVAQVRVTSSQGTSEEAVSFTYNSNAPTVTGRTPNNGPETGGTPVTITGTNFIGVSSVTFGGVGAASTVVNSATQILATTPPHATGQAQIQVTNASGTSTNNVTFNFQSSPPTVTNVNPTAGPTTGGTQTTVSGSNFVGVTSVAFGGVSAVFNVTSPSLLTATTPAHAAGTVDVTVSNASGASTPSGGASPQPDEYTYVVTPPVVLSVNPQGGAAGTQVSIHGTNFVNVTSVMFGGVPASGCNTISPTQITATAPAHAPGPADVRVTNLSGTSAQVVNFNYS
jgi:hypothetical protein